MRAVLLLGVLASACTTTDAPGVVDLEGRWATMLHPVRGTCEVGSSNPVTFDLVRTSPEDFRLTLQNGNAFFGSVAPNQGCDDGHDGCYVAISLVSPLPSGTQLSTFGLDVTPEGDVSGKMFAAIRTSTASCDHYFTVDGTIE